MSLPLLHKDLQTLLLEERLLSLDQVEAAQRDQRRRGCLFQESLLELKLLDPDLLLSALSGLTGHPAIFLHRIVLETAVVEQLPRSLAETIPAIVVEAPSPKSASSTAYLIATPDPQDFVTLDLLRRALPTDAHILLGHALKDHIHAAIDLYYPSEQGPLLNPEGETIRLVQSILTQAIRLGASDIHIQPLAKVIQLKLRIDGVLGHEYTLHKDYWSALCVRLKVMSRVNMSESRRPQSGRFSLTYAGRDLDFRVAFHPTVHGENIVLRILDRLRSLRTLTELGFTAEDCMLLIRYANHPQGLMIFSGPTGAGKTTTLYALLAHMDTKQKNIMTLEDPVEYELPSIRQTDVREGGPFTFAEGIRSLLRQDPDVIFVSEIRDVDTAHMALRAAMTGHLVLATLHAADSFSIPGRLRDLGIEGSLLSGSLICAVSQRLVRKICTACKAENQKNRDQPHCPVCSLCQGTGYHGRIVIGEILPITAEIDTLITQSASRAALALAAQRSSVKTLWEKGMEQVQAGVTDREEIERVIGAPL